MLALYVARRRQAYRRAVKWDRRFDSLSEYNTLKAHASGAMRRVADTPEQRAETQRQAQEHLAALSADYVKRMEALQAEYDSELAP